MAKEKLASAHALFALCLLGLFVASHAVPCYPWTQPSIWIETHASLMEVVGPQEIRFYPKDPITGEADKSVVINHYNRKFVELDNYPYPNCIDVSPDLLLPIIQANIRRINTLDWYDFNCDYQFVTEALTPTINTTALVFNLTLEPDSTTKAPDLHIEFNFTVTKGGNYDVNYGSSPLSGGKDYVAQYRDGQIKFSFRVENWPWQGVQNRSYLGVYFDGFVNSSDPYTYTISNSNEKNEEYVSIQTEKWLLAQNIDHMFMVDGVPSLKKFDPNFEAYLTWNSVGGNVSAYTGGISGCRGNGTGGPMPHWTKLEYDPQFSAIFLSPPTPDTVLTPTQKKSSKTVSIAVGVTFGVVGVLVAAVIIAMLVSPSFRNFVRPFAKRGGNSAPHRIGSEHMAPESPSSPKARSESSWVRGSKGH